MGEVAVPFITTPLLLHQETEDPVQMNVNGLPSPPWNLEQTAYVEKWRQEMTAYLKTISSPHAVFSPACAQHCVFETDLFFSVGLKGTNTTVQKVLQLIILKNLEGCSRISI